MARKLHGKFPYKEYERMGTIQKTNSFSPFLSVPAKLKSDNLMMRELVSRNNSLCKSCEERRCFSPVNCDMTPLGRTAKWMHRMTNKDTSAVETETICRTLFERPNLSDEEKTANEPETLLWEPEVEQEVVKRNLNNVQVKKNGWENVDEEKINEEQMVLRSAVKKQMELSEPTKRYLTRQAVIESRERTAENRITSFKKVNPRKAKSLSSLSEHQSPLKRIKVQTSAQIKVSKANPSVNRNFDDRKNNSIGCSKEITLNDWYIRLKSQNGRLIVYGFRSDDECSHVIWQSSAISERINCRTLRSSSGSIYKLFGKMNIYETIDQGLRKSVANKFVAGFPENWKSLLFQSKDGMDVQLPTNGYEQGDESSWKYKTNCHPPSENEENDHQQSDEEDGCKDSDNEEAQNVQSEIEEDAIPPIEEEKNEKFRLTRKKKKKVKTSSRKSRKHLQRKSIMNKTQSLSKTRSFTEPRSIAALKVNPLPQTRSGRVVVPPLAYWDNQSMKHAFDCSTVRAKRSSTTDHMEVSLGSTTTHPKTKYLQDQKPIKPRVLSKKLAVHQPARSGKVNSTSRQGKQTDCDKTVGAASTSATEFLVRNFDLKSKQHHVRQFIVDSGITDVVNMHGVTSSGSSGGRKQHNHQTPRSVARSGTDLESSSGTRYNTRLQSRRFMAQPNKNGSNGDKSCERTPMKNQSNSSFLNSKPKTNVKTNYPREIATNLDHEKRTPRVCLEDIVNSPNSKLKIRHGTVILKSTDVLKMNEHRSAVPQQEFKTPAVVSRGRRRIVNSQEKSIATNGYSSDEISRVGQSGALNFKGRSKGQILERTTSTKVELGKKADSCETKKAEFSDDRTKTPVITAKRGTLTYKRQLKEAHCFYENNHEDDFFSHLDSDIKKWGVMSDTGESVDGTLSSRSTSSYKTPPASRIPAPQPASRHRTPELELSPYGSLSNEGPNRKAVESYIHNRLKKGHRPGKLKKKFMGEGSTRPTKVKQESFFLKNELFKMSDSSGDNYKDEDEEEDVYFTQDSE